MNANSRNLEKFSDHSQFISDRFNRRLTLLLKALLVIGAALEAFAGNWQAAAATFGVVLVTFLPVLLGNRFAVRIPPEFELLAVIFVFASLFLGEVRGFYARYWWWDLLLHAGSGLLFGIFGFVLVYALNEKEDIHLSMNPGFVALFAFMFALGMGVLWEIFEFAVDQTTGANMQKSGLVDTMWDLIVDGLGALVISIMGYGYLKTAGTNSFLERWIHHFIVANPRLFSNTPSKINRK